MIMVDSYDREIISSNSIKYFLIFQSYNLQVIEQECEIYSIRILDNDYLFPMIHKKIFK